MATQQIKNRQIADDQITNAKIAPAAGIVSTKLADFSADRGAGGFKITNLGNGVAATDAINKGQLDAAITASAAGLAVKAPARAASTANVAGTYNATGGTSARGQFTAMPNTIDGVTLAAGNRVLLKNQSTPAQNGIWIVSTLGTGSNGVWDRATDADGDAEVTDGTALFIGEGTQAGTQWVLTTNAPITVGGGSGTSLTFTQFGAGQTYTADETTLTVSSNVFSIKALGVGTAQLAADAVTNAKLADNAVQQENLADSSVGTAELIDANVTAAKLATDSVSTIKIVDANVTLAKLAANSVDASKIVDGSVGSAELGTDSVTTIKITDANVTTAKLAANAVTGAKISYIAQTVTGTPNGVLTTFTTSVAATAASLLVFVNGIRQRPTTDYTYSGSTITFTTAPETGDDIAVYGMAA